MGRTKKNGKKYVSITPIISSPVQVSYHRRLKKNRRKRQTLWMISRSTKTGFLGGIEILPFFRSLG